MSTKDVPKSKFLIGQAIVIPGEASETDEELSDDEFSQRSTSANLPKKPTDAPTFQQSIAAAFTQKPKHDSLLHQKLRDAQINLAVDAADFTGRTTQQMNGEMQKVAQSLGAAQLTLQDATCHIRSVADDLYKIDDNLESVFESHSMIPDLSNFDRYVTVKKYGKFTK